MTMSVIQVIRPFSNENPFIVVKKPCGLPSAPLREGEDSALTEAVKLYPFIREVRGRKEAEYGLVHRIDTAACGLLLIAGTQKAYDELSDAQDRGLFIKGYSAQCRKVPPGALPGFPPCPYDAAGALAAAEEAESIRGCEPAPDWIRGDPRKTGTRGAFPAQKCVVTSRFRFWGRGRSAVRPVTDASGRAARKGASPALYTTEVTLTPSLKAVCRIPRGFRHQVRCHLAWLGFPVAGDALYNALFREGENFLFTADYLTFPHPLTGCKIEIRI